MQQTFTTNNEQETIDIGKKIAETLHGGDVVLLYGDLGAGKTTITKGIADFFEIKKQITSPTFALMNLFEINKNEIKKIAHIDTYRLKNENELIEIGAEDYIGEKNTLCVIEWPEKIPNLIKNKKTIEISMVHNDDHSRTITTKTE
jgi:tRNA threonylcarbamoyladenosine biosynthesis protein TsaE